MMDVEAVVARKLKATLNLSAFLEVPASPPDQYIVVEQVGGGSSFADPVLLDVDCWAGKPGRRDAAAIAAKVREAVRDLDEEPNIFDPKPTNTYRSNDPQTGRSRYTVQVSLRLCE